MKQSPLKELSVVDPNSRKGRLLHLYSVIEEIPPEKIDINSWRCGTHACVGGWAAMDPVFMEQGLSIESDEDMLARIYYEDYVDVNALIKFFGMTVGEGFYLFAVWHYPVQTGIGAKKMALAKIKELME